MSEPSGIDIPSSSGEQPGSQLPSWVAGGSPARFVAPDELLKMSVAMDNLALVHEIAIDPNFSVSDAPSNPIQAAIKENMHRAYWDLLTEDLAKDPPDYTHAFNLLMEIKETILNDILSSAHVRLRAEVNSVLDENSLRSKMEQNCMDVHGIGRFIIGLLGRLCAPERDTLVEKLRHEKGIVEMIKGIFNLMDIMKDDLTNYVLSTNRAAVEEYSSKFEYKEFLKYLEKFPDGSLMTKEWIKHAYLEIRPSTSDDSQPDQKREKLDSEEPEDDEVVKTTSRGYLKLVESQNPEPYPETLRIDRLRLAALAEKFLQMNVVTSAVLITCNLAGKQISESDNFKKSLKDQLIVITNDIEEKNLFNTLDAICEQCVATTRKCASSLNIQLSSDQEKALREQIKAIGDEGNAIRALVRSRIAAFVEEILRSPSEVPHRLLPGLSVIQSELCAFTARYTALGLGILWGAYRLRQIREYHADIREWEHEKAVAKAYDDAQRKKWLSREEMRYLMKVVDLPFEEGVAQFGVADLYRED
ncbi:T-complex protein 11 [Teladorsagia circumcincta]|uniref:T-complex protein 11 n=1 Tax=Teladorsagia circumcincta TaxID=45464 RepID=A0A2G9UZG3_TELCI|nr:T-complex protein 11 [Teladorsagia circumcincta]